MTRPTIARLTFLPDRDQTFTDHRGITHEALTTNHQTGVVSLCGRLKDPTIFVDKTRSQLRAFVSPRPAEGVDCMTCLVARVRLDTLISVAPLAGTIYAPDGMTAIDIRITSWR